MSNKSLFDIPMMMERNADSIGGAAREMFRGLKKALNEGADLSDDPISSFVDEVIQIALDWMGTGEVDQVRELLSQIRVAVNDEAEDIHCLDSLSLNSQLTVRLQELGQFMAIFLRTSNLSKYLGLLSGKRRATWREALQWIYKHNQPVRANDLCDTGLFTSDSTASNALNQLAGIGLLEKRKEGRQAVIYELTWAGRSVCRALGVDSISTSKHDIDEAVPIEEVEEYHEESSFAVIFGYSQPGMAKICDKVQSHIRIRGHWG